MSWPAGSVPVGVLLHDDGTKLWVVPLDGRPRLLWTHPEAHVYEIEVGILAPFEVTVVGKEPRLMCVWKSPNASGGNGK